MKEKKTVVIIFLAILSIVVTIVFKKISQNESDIPKVEGSTGERVSSNLEKKTIHNDGSLRKVGLKTALARLGSASLSQEDDYEEPPHVTREVAELHRKTKDFYFEMAPEVLEEMLQEQRISKGWTQRIEEAAQTALNYEESEGTNLSDVDCRAKLCKITFDHENLEKHDSFMDGRMDTGPWISEAGRALGGRNVKEDGTIESFIYFTGPGDYESFLNMRRRIAIKLD